MKISKLMILISKAASAPADTTVPTYSSGEIGTVDSHTVAVTFSEDITGTNYATGVTIKKDSVSQTISSATRQTNHAIVYYVLADVVSSGNTVTWEYAAASGNITDIATNPLGNVAAQTITNNTSAPVTGSVTQANMRLSTVNGTAFVDFNAANVLTNYLGCKLTITDHAGKKLIGYIKAAGAGQTYYNELLANTTFDLNTTNWSASSGDSIASVAGGQSNNCLEVTEAGGYGAGSQQPATINGALLRGLAYCKKGTDNECLFQINMNHDPWSALSQTAHNTTTWTLKTLYATSDYTSVNFSLVSDWTSGTSMFDEVSLKQVLTPSATGVTIVSALGGSIYNWASEDSGFKRNDGSNYTYQIEV